MELNLSTDDDVNRFFDKVVTRLANSGQYSQGEALSLTREYYQKFRDEHHCGLINIPVQDDDFFFHQGSGGMARRIHYYLKLKGDPDPQKFEEWLNSIGK